MSMLPHLDAFFAWLLAASWQASVLALLVLGLQQLFGARLNPRWRYALWLIVLLRLILPALPESALSLFQFAPPTPAVFTASVTEPLFLPPSPPSDPVFFAQITHRPAPLTVQSLLALVWLAGAITLLVLTYCVNRRFALQVAQSPAISDPEILRVFRDARAELGLTRTIRLVENTQVGSPAVMGLFQPTLLLPIDVRAKFDSTELRLIFLHELAHLKRGDVVIQALIALLQILHWFNPVLWYAFRRMRIDREPATDALVLSRAGEAEKERYGLMLIKLLEHFNQRHSLPTLVGILEDKDQFKRRFSLIAKFTRGAYGWSLLGAVILAVLAIAGLTQSHRFVRDPNLPYALDLRPSYDRVFQDPTGADSVYHGYAGPKTIDGLPFNIGGVIRLYGQENADRNKPYPDHVSALRIDRKFDELHLIHAVEWREYEGCPVATLRLHYADGTAADLPIRYDFQVKDWSRLFTEDEETLDDPDTKIIWRGAGGAEGTGRLFKSTLRNPFPGKKVDTMDVISTRSLASYDLVAATVAQTEPQRDVTAPMPLLPARHFDGTLNIHVIDGVTGAPVVGAKVFPAMIIGDISLVADPVLTGADGIAPLKYPRDGAKDIRVKVGKAGYITCTDQWETGWQAGSIPPEVTYQLQPDPTPPTPVATPPPLIPHVEATPPQGTVELRLTFIEVDEASYQRQAPAMDDAVKNGDLAFFTSNKSALAARRDAALWLKIGQPGWYSEGGVESYIASATEHPQQEGKPMTVLQARTVFLGLNADFQWAPDGRSITSVCAVTMPVALEPLGPASLSDPSLRSLTVPRLGHTTYTDKDWDLAPGRIHSFWVGESHGVLAKGLGQEGRPPSFQKIVAAETSSRLAVFMTAQADPPGTPLPNFITHIAPALSLTEIPAPRHTLHGRIVIPPASPVDLAKSNGELEPVDGIPGHPYPFTLQPDGTFTVTGVAKGVYNPVVHWIHRPEAGSTVPPAKVDSFLQPLTVGDGQGDVTLSASLGRIFDNPGKGSISISFKILEVDDADYQANQDQMNTAVDHADIAYFNNRKGVNLLSAPSVATQPGLQANIDIVREFPYPTRFDSASRRSQIIGGTHVVMEVPPTPREFAEKDIGISAEITPTIDDGNSASHGKIILNGKFKLTNFEGFTPSNLTGAQMPSFDTRESLFLEALDDNQQKGIWIPGDQLDEEILSSKTESVKKRLLLFLSAKREE